MLGLILLVFAIVCAVIATFVSVPKVNMLAAALAFYLIYILVGRA